MSRTRDSLFWVLKIDHGMRFEVPFKGLTGTRRFRWDAADEALKVAVEYQGIGAGHQWADAQATDHEKLTEGQLCGWVVVLCDAQSARSGRCEDYVTAALMLRRRGMNYAGDTDNAGDATEGDYEHDSNGDAGGSEEAVTGLRDDGL